ARRVDDEYILVGIVDGGRTDEIVLAALEVAVKALREEAALSVPWWNAREDAPFEVAVRDSVGWDFAPMAISYRGETTKIRGVLGRWIESGGAPGGELVCFRVRVAEGDGGELTLAYDARRDRWFQW